jgi:hypothetical protein
MSACANSLRRSIRICRLGTSSIAGLTIVKRFHDILLGRIASVPPVTAITIRWMPNSLCEHQQVRPFLP